MADVLELSEDILLAGSHINDACKSAVEMANKRGRPVHFKFNDTDVTVQPGELAADVANRWNRDMNEAHEKLINSDEYKQREAKREAEAKAADVAVMMESAQTETEMRDAKVPSPRTEKQLTEYIKSLVDRQHDYGTCCYALSMAAEAAFNYVAHHLGVTGFQASIADLDFIKRTRSIKGPFMLIKGEDALYPQYDLIGKVEEALVKWRPWLKEEAEKKLTDVQHAHPDVEAHWKKLAGG